MYQVSRVPPSPEAAVVVGVAATVVTTTVATVTQLSSSAASGLQLPNVLKEFIKTFGTKAMERVDKKKLKPKEKARFITGAEVGVLAVSILVTTFVVGFVKAGGLSQFLQPSVFELLLLTFFSVCLMKIVTVVSEAFCSRRCDVQKKLSLWWVGSTTFFVTGVVFLFPFSSPTITRYDAGIPKPTKALMSLSKMLMLLTLAAPFGLMAASSVGFLVTMGDAGLLAVLATVGYSLLPIPLLPGRDIYNYKKALCVVAVVPMLLLLYGFTMQVLPYWIYVIVGVVSVVLAGAGAAKLRSQAKCAEKTPSA